MYYYKIKELCIKLVIETSLYYDAQSEKHQITLSQFPHAFFHMLSSVLMAAAHSWRHNGIRLFCHTQSATVLNISVLDLNTS
jgi:hypothetical protein